MQCDSCGKPATVHLTDVSNNSKQELHLCEDCAKSQGVTIKSYLHKSNSALDLLPKIVEAQTDAVGERDEKDLVCPRCGMSYRKFRSTGKFGCPHDYVVFKRGLVGLLEKIHGRSQHTGKVPTRAGDEIERQKELRHLRSQLEEAVRSEEYERAAELRDRIHRVERPSPSK
jgi:protein arginine kinase activator